MRWRTGALLALLAAALLAPPPASAEDGGRTSHQRYTSRAGSLDYALYTPPSRGQRLSALVVVLPGAGETSDGAALRSGWSRVARRYRFVVAYPEQNLAYSAQRSWDWAKAAQDGRTGREASLIAGLTGSVVARQHLDPRRVFVTGFSAGAGMASAMAVLFPDVYRALGLEAGCPFDAIGCNGRSVTARQSAAAAIAAMGRYRRPVPVFNEYGSLDEISLGVGSYQVVRSWLTVADTLDNGTDDGTVPRSPASSRLVTPALPHKPYRVTTFADRHGCPLAEDWVVVGETHAWAGGAQSGPTDTESDPLAPDVPTAMWLFFSRTGCR